VAPHEHAGAPPISPLIAPGRETGSPPPAAGPTADRSLRLSRRGRLLATLAGTAVTVLLCLTLVPAVAAGVAAAFTGPPAPATTTVTVEPGQTLWQVAVAVDPGGDTAATAATVARIADANGLTSAADLRPGQRLVVPVE
jgi:nucleoid-associated protein YgaU